MLTENMVHTFRDGRFPLAIMLLVSTAVLRSTNGFQVNKENVKSAVFLSPNFQLDPGEVKNKSYYNLPMPVGHIGIKSFNGEVVDEAGNPVPLHETYIHHWFVNKYYQREGKSHVVMVNEGKRSSHQSDRLTVRNSGVCQGTLFGQYFGMGSESRKTATHIPDPYAVEIGNPSEIPAGYEEKWMLNIHTIDMRGVEDKLGCREGRCDLYNVTKDEHGLPLTPGYRGGFHCCYDGTQCRKQRGFHAPKRNLYFRYTVKWVDWNRFVVPVKIYMLDVTDTSIIRLNNSTGDSMQHNCQAEYEVESCSEADKAGDECIHVKRTGVSLTKGGYVIYGVAHQHSGGIGSTLYGGDGRLICSSTPTYGKGDDAGNEEGYIVGMSTCYPKPGSVKIDDGEKLKLESNYSSTQLHVGVPGVFYLLIADQLP